MDFTQENVINKVVIPLLNDIGFIISGRAKQLCPVDTGRLRASIDHKIIPEELAVVVGTNVPYACVIGAKHKVYNPCNGGAEQIGNCKFDDVLSKDGKPHKILARHIFSNAGKSRIDGISIKVKKGRNPLIVTRDHLILTLRNENLLWLRADELILTDKVFRKRSHNSITDGSDEKIITCICGKEFSVKKFSLRFRNAKYCSQECYHNHTYHNRAEGKHWKLTAEQIKNHFPLWNGKSTILYDWRFNNRLKKIVRNKYGNVCQMCGKKKSVRELCVHHIDMNKTNSDVNNLIPLCGSCHVRLHNLSCELPDVNLKIFRPVSIIDIKKITFKRKSKEKLPCLYDLSVENENSFVCGGILIHNSYVEYMYDVKSPHPGRETGQMPFLRPAIFQLTPEINKMIKERLK